MTGRRGAVLGLALIVLAGCGSDGTKGRRAAVNRYLDGVQRAQVDLIGHQGQIDAALQRFSLAQPTAEELRALRRGRARVDATLRGVQALDTPAEARRLSQLLVARLRLQRDLLDELVLTSLDARRLAGAAPRLQAAARGLRADLGAISSAPRVPAGGSASVLDRYGEAFGRYGDALRPVAATFRADRTASLLRPTLDEQRTALSRSIALCDRIRSDLRRHDVVHANAAINSLLSISGGLNGLALRRAEAAVAQAYDARIHRLDTLEQGLAQERARLVREVG